MDMRRGFTSEEAMEYVKATRRTFDEKWKPRLRSMKQGTSIIYDKRELDFLFDQFMSNEATVAPSNDKAKQKDGDLSESILTNKGKQKWQVKQPGYSRTKMAPGPSTKSSEGSAFASAASKVLRRPMTG